MTRTILNRQLGAVLAGSVMAFAFKTTSPLVRQECGNADAQLARVLQPLEALRAKGCDAGDGHGASECERLRRELERLEVICPGHAPTLMANAVIAYDEHQPVKSQQLLDVILAQPRSYPDAAVLRARIAIGLHETYGAALYLGGLLPEARRELTLAGALGAPRWRIAYHLGLVEEASGRFEDARRHYAEALEANPGWAPAQSRLNALRAKSER